MYCLTLQIVRRTLTKHKTRGKSVRKDKERVTVCGPHLLNHLQCIRRAFTALHFFHILLCYSLIPICIKVIIFLKIFLTIPDNDNVKEVCLKSLQIINKKNHMYISIHSLCSILGVGIAGYLTIRYNHDTWFTIMIITRYNDSAIIDLLLNNHIMIHHDICLTMKTKCL